MSRSHESVLREAEKMTSLPGFKGYISDLGGATANFRKPACKQIFRFPFGDFSAILFANIGRGPRVKRSLSNGDQQGRRIGYENYQCENREILHRTDRTL